MKQIFILAVVLVNLSFMTPNTSSFHNFKVQSIDGSEFDLASLKGKKVLVVNVASECGFTPQYETLQELYESYKDDNFTIIAFPSNDFGAQEPGTNEEINSFCKKNYGVTFPIMSKITVKGEDIHPVYKWLTMKSENGVQDAEVKWNFQKFLINPDGSWEATVSTQKSPACNKILDWINA